MGGDDIENENDDDIMEENISSLKDLKIDNNIYYGFNNKYSLFFSNLHVF